MHPIGCACVNDGKAPNSSGHVVDLPGGEDFREPTDLQPPNSLNSNGLSLALFQSPVRCPVPRIRALVVGYSVKIPGIDPRSRAPVQTVSVCDLCVQFVFPRRPPRHGPPRDLPDARTGPHPRPKGTRVDRRRGGGGGRPGDLVRDVAAVRRLVRAELRCRRGDGRRALHANLRFLCGDGRAARRAHASRAGRDGGARLGDCQDGGAAAALRRPGVCGATGMGSNGQLFGGCMRARGGVGVVAVLSSRPRGLDWRPLGSVQAVVLLPGHDAAAPRDDCVFGPGGREDAGVGC